MSEQDVLRDEVEREHAKVLEVEEQRDGLLDALRAAKRQHLIVDDCWYSCPKSGNCCDDSAEGCRCGADKHNAAIDAAIEKAGK